MQPEQAIAEDLAVRLTELGVGAYAARDGLVVRATAVPLTLRPVSAGRGRPSDTERALRRRVHIHLSDAGLSVHVEEVGLGPINPAPRALSSLSGATGAVVIALLEAPEAEHEVTMLAEQAGVSPATAQRVVFGLEAPTLTAVSRPELWVQGPRTPEYLLRAVDGIVSDDVDNLILWCATTRGPMALSRYGEDTPHLRLASRFRVYADLLASPQRGREQADVYRER